MEQKTKRNTKRNVANFFGAFGYLFCFLQWLWVVLLYFSVIQSVILLVTPSADSHVEQTSAPIITLPSSLSMVILAVTVAVMIAVTVYAFIKIPTSIVKTGNKVVHKTAETMTPLVVKAQHKKDTKKFRDKITAELILIIKLLLIVIPVALTVGSVLLAEQSVNYSIALIIGATFACFSVIFFAVQYALAGMLHVKLKDLF
jgi:hypothetical protein